MDNTQKAIIPFKLIKASLLEKNFLNETNKNKR